MTQANIPLYGHAPVGTPIITRLPSAWRGSFDPVSLENWDPAWIRATLPVLTRIRDLYYRGHTFGLDNIPDGPFVLVGSHGGGPMNVLADNLVLFSSFYEWNHVSRPLYAAAHHIIFHLGPVGHLLAKYGAVDGKHEVAAQILRSGQGFVVFPGGEEDMARPIWRRNKVDFRGHVGFAKVAIECGAPIVPFAETGGHSIELVLTPGYRLAKALHLSKLVGLKTFPIALTLPWGVTIGYWPYLPLPARITQVIGKPMRFSASERERRDPAFHRHVARQVEAEVQRLTNELRRCEKAKKNPP